MVLKLRSSPPLLRSTRALLAGRPLTVALMVYCAVTQATVTPVTSAVALLPLPLAGTMQVWPSGWVFTVRA